MISCNPWKRSSNSVGENRRFLIGRNYVCNGHSAVHDQNDNPLERWNDTNSTLWLRQFQLRHCLQMNVGPTPSLNRSEAVPAKHKPQPAALLRFSTNSPSLSTIPNPLKQFVSIGTQGVHLACERWSKLAGLAVSPHLPTSGSLWQVAGAPRAPQNESLRLPGATFLWKGCEFHALS